MCPTVMEESESTGSIPEVVETLVVNITPESILTNCGPWCPSRPELSMLDNLQRLLSLTVPEQDFTRFWARVFFPSSQLLSRPDSSQEELKRRSRLSEVLAS